MQPIQIIGIDAVEEEQKDLQTAMAKPEFYEQSQEKIKKDSERFEKVSRMLEDSITEWADLEERK